MNLKNSTKSIFILYVTMAAIGVSQYKNYGIGLDEPYLRRHGASTAKYVLGIFYPSLLNKFSGIPFFNSLPILEYSQDRTHGTVFELPLTLIEVMFNLTSNLQKLYFTRHLIIYLFCVVCVISVFKFLSWRYASIPISLLGAVILFVSPRQFADFFYNSKDSVFMTAYTISLIASIKFIIKPKKTTALFAGFACAYAIDIRPIAIIIPLLLLIFVFIKNYFIRLNPKKSSYLVLFIITLFSSIYLMWPYLWANPLYRFLEVCNLLSKYNLVSGMQNLTAGSYADATSPPWYYLLIWMCVTIPLPYLSVIFFGILLQIKKLFNINKIRIIFENEKSLADTFILVSCLLPIFIAILLKSTLYDGWRHFYFVYPSLVIIGIYGWVSIWDFLKIKEQNAKILLVFITLLGILFNGIWMINNRPLQNIYFNSLAGSDIRSNWEMDYWGLSSVQAIKYVLSHSTNKTIRITQGNESMQLNHSAYLLDQNQVSRIQFVKNWADADYLITNYRGVAPKDDYKYELLFEPIFRKWVGNANVYTIYKRKNK